MRAFRYHLAPLLKRAQHAEQRLQIDLAQRQNELLRARQHLASLQRLQLALHVRLRHLQAGDIDLPRSHAVARDLQRIDALLARADRLCSTLEQAIDHTRQRLLHAARSRQLFESHRDTLARLHRQAESTAEAKLLDELATSHSPSSRPRPGGAA
jgi:flagellar export protein FliJ